MKDLIAKYRALFVALSVLFVAAGCRPSQAVVAARAKTDEGVQGAVAEAKKSGPQPVTVKEAPPLPTFGMVSGKPIAWAYDPRTDSVSFITLTFGATGNNPAGWIIDPTTGALKAPSGKVIEGVNYMPSPAAVGTANVASLSGTQTVDGVSITATKKVWLFGQTTSTQDGCWVGNVSTWTRCTELSAGDDAAGDYFAVGAGTANKGVWIVQNSAGAGISGTNDLTGFNLSTLAGAGALTSVFARTGAVVATQGDYTAAQVGAISGVDVYVASSGALPTYTAALGTLGVGGTLTANANGAFPTVNGRTLTANAPVNGLIYVRHGASAVDNGVYMLTTQGSGGAPWVLTRYALLDQAAELPGSKLRVVTSGSEFVYTATATPVIGTTHIFYKEIGTRIGPQYGVRYQSDFGFVLTTAVSSGVAIPNTDLIGLVGVGGSLTTNVTNTSTQRGVFSCITGSTAVWICGFQGGFTAAVTQPDGGDAITISQDMGWDWTWTVAEPVLSDGTNTYAANIGWSKTRNNSQKISTDYVGFISDSTSGVSTTHWLTALAAAGVSTGTVIDSGVTITAGQYYRLRCWKDAGDLLIHFSIDGVEIGTGSSTNVSTDFLSMLAMIFRSAGTGTINPARFGSVRVDIDYPQGLAA